MEIPFLTDQKKSVCSRALFGRLSWANCMNTYQQTKTRWWFQTLFAYHPYLWTIPIFNDYFLQLGWSCHLEQPSWVVHLQDRSIPGFLCRSGGARGADQPKCHYLFRSLLKVGKGMEIQTWHDIHQYSIMNHLSLITTTLRLYHSFSSFFIPSFLLPLSS